MPLMRSIEKLADGFRIVRSNGTILTLTSADIPGTVKAQSIASVQTWVNSWLQTNGFSGVSRIRTVTPLDTDIAIGASANDVTNYKFGALNGAA